MCTATFRLLLVWNGKAELLAAPIVFMAGVEAYLVGRCGLNMRVKDGDIHQAIKIVSDYLVTLKTVLLVSDIYL